ncbi:branched-chain amino acid ABC transporter permease [Salinispirillum marinum]
MKSLIGKRELILFGLLLLAIVVVFGLFGSAYGTRMLVEIACYAIIALGLSIQWGYAGQFNAGVMGFVALGGFFAMFFSMPINDDFWGSDLPGQLGGVFLRIAIGLALIYGASKLNRFGLSPKLRTVVTVLVAIVVYFWIKSNMVPVTQAIERDADFIGGLGLPPWSGWIVGGMVAGFVGYFIGRICLGLRSDYLAIATLGCAEIIKAFLKNEDWLTRGIATVSPLPWPVPQPIDVGFVAARAMYFSVTAVMIMAIYFLLHRAYHAPWGRMIRAIRDNEISASAMGKDVNKRSLEIFVLGCFLMGLGGATLGTFNGLFDPSGYVPLNHTFLVLVMVILGGPGNNTGTIIGAAVVYIIWIMSEPLALWILQVVTSAGDAEAQANLASRALQARVFSIGLLIVLVLRYAPKGLLPEKIQQHN